MESSTELDGFYQKIHILVMLLGTKFETRNCISEPGPQEPYMAIVFETHCKGTWGLSFDTNGHG
jgi:hypothetical protein